MILSKNIKKLKINSFLLFLFPIIAILGSLFIHNSLVGFKLHPQKNYSHIKDIPGEKYYLNCTTYNEYCAPEGSRYLYEKVDKIDNCHIHTVDWVFSFDGKYYPAIDSKFHVKLPSALYLQNAYLKNLEDDIVTDSFNYYALKDELKNSKIALTQNVTKKKNLNCIKNHSTIYFFYKYFPPYTYVIDKRVKGSIILGTGVKVNPFLYGEVSISNLVKRPPIKYFFKFFLYIGVILMISYWYNYNKIFNKIIDKKQNVFYFLGLTSAIFLFLHVYFLGTTSTNEFLKDFRRIVILLFILFEVFAQGFLAFKIYNNRNIFAEYCYKSIVLTKIFFVIFMVTFTVIIMIVLSVLNLPSTVDYILEWNYFVVLLFFYLLSSLMWKKLIFNPSSTKNFIP